jgi:hypothetical protein
MNAAAPMRANDNTPFSREAQPSAVSRERPFEPYEKRDDNHEWHELHESKESSIRNEPPRTRRNAETAFLDVSR